MKVNVPVSPRVHVQSKGSQYREISDKKGINFVEKITAAIEEFNTIMSWDFKIEDLLLPKVLYHS